MYSTLAMSFFTLLFTLLSFSTSLCFAQEDRVFIDQSRIPLNADSVGGFVPPGWKIEEQASGDLNNDSLPDYVLKLVGDESATGDDGIAYAGQRALVIVFGNKNGKLSRAAVAGKLLQCTTCGGAFYGAMEAPAKIRIEKDVLIVEQDHGSRDVVTQTYRFRYEPDTRKFVLIGFDFACRDRATGEEVSESTNYLTGVRITARRKGKTDKTSRESVSKEKTPIEQVDSEEYDAAAVKRLHL